MGLWKIQPKGCNAKKTNKQTVYIYKICQSKYFYQMYNVLVNLQSVINKPVAC